MLLLSTWHCYGYADENISPSYLYSFWRRGECAISVNRIPSATEKKLEVLELCQYNRLPKLHHLGASSLFYVVRGKACYKMNYHSCGCVTSSVANSDWSVNSLESTRIPKSFSREVFMEIYGKYGVKFCFNFNSMKWLPLSIFFIIFKESKKFLPTLLLSI